MLQEAKKIEAVKAWKWWEKSGSGSLMSDHSCTNDIRDILFTKVNQKVKATLFPASQRHYGTSLPPDQYLLGAFMNLHVIITSWSTEGRPSLFHWPVCVFPTFIMADGLAVSGYCQFHNPTSCIVSKSSWHNEIHRLHVCPGSKVLDDLEVILQSQATPKTLLY